MQKFVVVVAGGKGLRMGSEIPKQFMVLNHLPILMHTLSNFYQWDNEVNLILVLPENQLDYWNQLCLEYQFTVPHQITKGGETRFHSVLNGLQLVPKNTLVAIHDAVRPFVSKNTIQQCFDERIVHKVHACHCVYTQHCFKVRHCSSKLDFSI